MDKHGAGKLLIGIYEGLDSERLRRSLDEKLKSIEESIGTWEDRDPFSYCREDYTSGIWEHSPECPSWYNHLGNCVIKDFDDVSYRLKSLSLLPLLTLAFQNPLLANGQRLLNGLAGNRGVYSHRFGNRYFQIGSYQLTLPVTCSETSTGVIHVSAMLTSTATKSLRNGRT